MDNVAGRVGLLEKELIGPLGDHPLSRGQAFGHSDHGAEILGDFDGSSLKFLAGEQDVNDTLPFPVQYRFLGNDDGLGHSVAGDSYFRLHTQAQELLVVGDLTQPSG